VAVVRFDRFELDDKARTLRKNGTLVKLHDQPFELLLALVERAGEVVSREDLRRRLWPADTFVDYDNSLNNALSRLRDCLEDGPAGPRFIETVPRRGYRFVAALAATSPATPGPRRARRWVLPLAGAVAILALVAAGQWLGRSSPGPEGRQRLIVLPLENLTGDPALDYLVEAIGEDLITHIGRLSPQRLAVIARTTAATYAKAQMPISRVRSELDVDHVVEGAVRREQRRLHVTVRLIRASDESQVWAEMFDAGSEPTAAFFRDVTTRTAGAVATALGESAAVVVRAATLSTEAFDAWLRARHEWNRFNVDGFLASIEWDRRALTIDPTLSQAATGLAKGWVFLGVFDPNRAVDAYTQASLAIDRALQLDPESSEALAMRAMVKLFAHLDRAGAARDFEAALARSPNDALTLHWAAAAASASGDHERSVALARNARSLDPKSVAVNADLGWYFYYARRFDDALSQCTAAGALDPSARGPLLCREMVLRATRRSPVTRTPAATDRSALYLRAADGAALGDRRAALGAIQAAMTSRASWAPFIAVDPAFDALRGDEEFRKIVADR
jgi:TolB-like protein/DNA-binding winged helix-turn-helix (wHTH) protein